MTDDRVDDVTLESVAGRKHGSSVEFTD